MMLFLAICLLAVFPGNLARPLAYKSVVQIGYLLVRLCTIGCNDATFWNIARYIV
jgi:NADH:ubiquinone oxidoreductase subunit 2 (subunit N)